MKNSNKSIAYHARIGSKFSLGVTNKINQIVDAFNHNGQSAYLVQSKGDGITAHINFAKDILSSKADILIIRMTAFSMLLIAPIIIIQRIRGKEIIIDVPTPPSVVLHEVSGSNANIITKALLNTIIRVSFPFSLWPANRVVASVSEESKYFNFLLGKKTRIVGNGIDTSRIPVAIKTTPNKQHEVVLISVSSLGAWHGIDRIIDGIYEYTKIDNNSSAAIVFYVVGDGSERQSLEERVSRLQLTKTIKFTGNLQGKDLDAIFSKSDAAFSSLGLHRKKLNITAELKNREYLARNMPIIMSEIPDIDIPDHLDFVHTIPATDDPVDIADILKFINKVKTIKGDSPRKFAEENLDYRIKVKLYTQ